MRMRRFKMFALLFWLPFALITAHADLVIPSQVDADIEKWRQFFAVPGIAVAVVQGDKIVYAKGFGFRDRELGLPVTTKTLFQIGSTSKAFTAAGVGLMVQEGKLRWDQPIAEYFPRFQLQDPVASRQATMLDIMSHRTGLPRHDLAWYGYDSVSMEHWFDRLRELTPSKSFREIFQYNNFMFMAAGYISSSLAGQSWTQFMHERLLEPLDMKQTIFDVEQMEKSADAARPYSMVPGEGIRRVPYRPVIGLAPAGAIISNLEDMSHWLMMNMNDGVYNGRQVIGSDALKVIHTPQVVVPGRTPIPGFSSSTYALGWMVNQYYGHDYISHNGGIDGMLTHVGYLPEEKIGIVIFQNADFEDLTTRLQIRLLDEILHLPPNPVLAKPLQPVEVPVVQELIAQPLIRSAADYIGVYENSLYGALTLREENGVLKGRFHDLEVEPVHIGQGMFKFRTTSDIAWATLLPQLPPLQFEQDDACEIALALWQLEPEVPALKFIRKRPTTRR